MTLTSPKLTEWWVCSISCVLRSIPRLCSALLLGCAIATLVSAQARADIGVPPAPVYNLYGGIGLLDMPTARFAPDGEISASVSTTHMIDHYDFGFQALPWLETTFRYSRVDRYLERHEDLYDRSLGFKIRLSKEDEYWPSIAVGAQDILGTGAFGGEYFVASKRLGDFDFTVGVGWRALAGYATFSNPFGLLFSSFKTYNQSVTTGTPLLSDFFHGSSAGLFGGVSWNTPIDGLVLLAELSGDRYARERQVGALDYKTPLNFGFSYQVMDNVQIGGGYFYGSQFGIRATIALDPFAPEPPARLGTPPPLPHVRSSEESNEAVLSMLQDRTHFYDNWPGGKLAITNTKMGYPASAQPELADVLFKDAAFKETDIRYVETFGNSLVVDTSGRNRQISCGAIRDVLVAARNEGLSEIILSSDSSSNVQMCHSGEDTASAATHPIRYASTAIAQIDTADISGSVNDTNDEISGAAGDGNDSLQKRIVKGAEAQNITIIAIHIMPHQIDVAYSNGNYRTDAEAIGRLLRVLMTVAPNEIEKFRIVSSASGLPTIGTTFSRSDIERTLNLYGSGSDLLPLSQIAAVSGFDPLISDYALDEFPSFGYSFGPGYRQSLFDPQQPYRFEIYADARAALALTRHWNIGVGLEYNIYNTFNITRASDSLLPHVRSDFANYYKKGINGISYLQTGYFDKLAPNVYGFVRAGLLESMYAGVGGEVLWQPDNRRWALAGALYAVQQRGFDRLFDLRHYKVITGHLGLYYNSPFEGLDFALFAGRYLAGDYGATLRVTRRFDSGVEIGIYATLTNVPFHIYGEGSFDKGFIIRIPLDTLLPVNTQREMQLDFTPLTRDGGQMVDNEFSIYDAVRRSSEGELLTHWDEVLRP